MVLRPDGDWFCGPVRLPLKANYSHPLFESTAAPFIKLGVRGGGGAVRFWVYPTTPPDHPDYLPAGDLYTSVSSHS